MTAGHSIDESADRPSWHRLYYLLALFDICAICVSLYSNHRIMDIYTQSVTANETWVGISHDASELAELAGLIAGPGNDVFQSREVEVESTKSRQSCREFNDRLVSLREALAAQSQSPLIASMVEDLKTARSQAAQMVRDTQLTFAYLAAGQLDRATTYIASVNRRAATVNSTLTRLRGRIGALQNEQFKTQTSAAALLQQSEYLIAGLITLMILGATAYGRLIAKQVALVTRGKEIYRRELEQRVAERTADLAAAYEVRARLLKQLLTAQEDERRRIARDLHDGVGQSLTYLIKSLRALDVPGAGQDTASQLLNVAVETLDEVRRMARGLRPTILDDLGLQPALERMVSDFSANQHIAAKLEDESLADPRLPGEIETALYRIVQEALTNIAKHAGASEVRVGIHRNRDSVEAVVEDNGRGIQSPSDGPTKPSMGLSSIRERATLLGGCAEITSSAEKGTRVSVRLPLDGR